MTEDGQLTAQTDVSTEEIEGLGENQPNSWGEYTIDTPLIRNETRSVYEVLWQTYQGRIVIDRDFQREPVWDVSKQSKLIESVVMRIPLPVFYLAEDRQGQLVVVDGLQRLSTFRHFMRGRFMSERNDGFKLRLSKRPELDGKRFEDLPPRLQNRLEDCNLILYIIDAAAPEQTRLDFFERVKGDVSLTGQQMRNRLYSGLATEFLREASRTDLFQEATGGSLRQRTMRDREFINRFCAFQILSLDEYRDMDEFLAMCLTKMNQEPYLAHMLSIRLERALRNNLQLFGMHAFRRHNHDQKYPNAINASLWDVMSTGLASASADIIEQRAAELRAGFQWLLRQRKFDDSITHCTNSVNHVKRRFSMVDKMLESVLHASAR